MALPDPEGEMRAFQEKEKSRAILNIFIRILIIDAIVIALYIILARLFGWDETALMILLFIIAVGTGFYYQWQKQKIGR